MKNALFALIIIVKIRQNNKKFVKDWFVTKMGRKNIFYRDVTDKMAASSKLSPQYHGVTVIL